MSHKGQRVLITAAGSGIGRGVAEHFLDAGAKVFICDIDRKALDKTLKEQPKLKGIVADVASEESVDELFKKALAHLSGLDILVNTAGTAGPVGPVESMDLGEWRRCIAVNLDGAFLCSRKAAPIFKAQKSGSIVNFSSVSGLFGYPNRGPYCAAKWGLIGFTKTLAIELGPYGVRANAICPGAVEGARMEHVLERESAMSGKSKEELRKAYTAGSSLKTWITAGDLADMVLFLTSPAGKKISGQALAVDGHTENPLA
jgi:NAD(P)-dependent dehydrogenase (short-subunit alcohol dehydrogenase family)